MKCEKCYTGVASLIHTHKQLGLKEFVCANCYINLKGLRGDYEHSKRQKEQDSEHQ